MTTTRYKTRDRYATRNKNKNINCQITKKHMKTMPTRNKAQTDTGKYTDKMTHANTQILGDTPKDISRHA